MTHVWAGSILYVMNTITIYSTPTCVYCKAAKDFFKENNVVFEEKDVAEDEKAREDMIAKSGQLGVPVIDVHGSIVVGFDKRKLAELLGLR